MERAGKSNSGPTTDKNWRLSDLESKNSTNGVSRTHTTQSHQLTALQQHVLFWDPDNDGIIYPWDVYNGFRALGFGILFSLASLLIPIFFSYPTSFSRSWLPDPWLRIFVDTIANAKHGSDTGVFDVDGHFHPDRFDALFDRWDASRSGGLSAAELWAMWKKNRCAADPAGWSFAFMEMATTWLLLQRDGRVWKEDLRGCYDGTILWTISERTQKGRGQGWDQGYGVSDFIDGMSRGATWKNWELKES